LGKNTEWCLIVDSNNVNSNSTSVEKQVVTRFRLGYDISDSGFPSRGQAIFANFSHIFFNRSPAGVLT